MLKELHMAVSYRVTLSSRLKTSVLEAFSLVCAACFTIGRTLEVMLELCLRQTYIYIYVYIVNKT